MTANRNLPAVPALVVAWVSCTTGADAASRFGPPTSMMLDGENQVAIAVAGHRPEEGKVSFDRVEVLSGDMPETVLARIDPKTADGLATGEPYIVAYTEVRRNPLDRETRELDPAGPRIIALPAVGAAVFVYTAEMRAVLEAVLTGQPEFGRDYLEPTLALLGHEDDRTRRFAATELYLRPGLLEHLESGDVAVIREAIESPANDPESRAFLLETSFRLPSSMLGPWLGETARTIVTGAPTELDLSSTYPLLVLNALRVLGSFGALDDRAEISRHCASNSPGVAKTALATLELLDPDAAAARARALLARGGLQQSTRQAMEQFLARYERGESGV